MVHEGSAPDHSFVALRATRECVIGIPSVELAEKAVAILTNPLTWGV
jgi:hypothetical protein